MKEFHKIGTSLSQKYTLISHVFKAIKTENL